MIFLQVSKDLNDLDIVFDIRGECVDEEFKAYMIEKSASYDNLNISFKFVPDSEICDLIRTCDIIALPYNKKSSMNSGAVILAFSNKKNVICPLISTIYDFSLDDTYCYDYNTSDEHIFQFENQIRRAYYDWKYNNESFLLKSEKLFEEVRDHNSLDVVSDAYKNLFDIIS